MKRLIASLALVSLLLPSLVLAADLRGGKELTLRKGDVSVGDLYMAGGMITDEGSVAGDLNVAGGTILFLGDVLQDLQALGGTLTFTGAVGDDLRAVGGNITVGSKVAGDVLVAGGQVSLLPSSIVSGDLVVAGGKVLVSGNVAGKARIYGSDVTLDGDITGPIVINAEKLTIGSNAVLHGDVMYRSAKEATVVSGSEIKGKLSYEPVMPDANATSKAFWLALFGVWVGIKMLMLLAASLLVCLYFRKATARVTKQTFEKFGVHALVGFAFLVATPIAGVILCSTVVGAMLGILLLLGYVAILIVSSIYLPAVIGSEIMRYFRKESEAKISVSSIVVGVIVLTLLTITPVLGWALSFVMFLGVLGSTLSFKWNEMQEYR